MDDKTLVAVVGIIGLASLESVAMIFNRDGAMFGAVVAGIGTIIGYCFGLKQAEILTAKEVKP